jgi:hypothetical protein
MTSILLDFVLLRRMLARQHGAWACSQPSFEVVLDFALIIPSEAKSNFPDFGHLVSGLVSFPTGLGNAVGIQFGCFAKTRIATQFQTPTQINSTRRV